MNSYRFGIFGELFLMILLKLKGYRIVARRYKTKLGEIDLIASRGKNLTIFEVKSRRGKDLTTDLVCLKQRKRIENATKIFLSKNNKYLDFNIEYCIFLFKNIFNYNFYK